jgi:glycosyltransferase involved in cell wall biosynthesis
MLLKELSLEDYPKIDILMATFNGEKFLREQILSILDQDYGNFSLIISDDASIDSTPEIIRDFQKKYPDKIQFYPLSENIGVVNNFSRLMELSESNYSMFADQDDVWLPFKISVTIKKMKELENKYGEFFPLLVATDLSVVDENLQIIHPSFWKFSHINPLLGLKLNRVLVRGVFTGCTMMLNRELLELSCPIPKESITHDYWIGLIAPSFGKIGIIHQATILYRTHAKNVMGTWASRVSIFHLIHSGQQFHVDSTIRAYVFYRYFSHRLNEELKEILKAYITLKLHSFFVELIIRCRYWFFRNDIKSNLVLLGSSLKMGRIKEIGNLPLD